MKMYLVIVSLIVAVTALTDLEEWNTFKVYAPNFLNLPFLFDFKLFPEPTW